MKSFLLLATLALSAVGYAQTPSVKWTTSEETVTGWLDLNGQFYFYDGSNPAKFVLYKQMSTTPKFETTYPSGFQLKATDYAFPIPDISGDGKDDIELDGTMNDRLLIDGSTAAVIYYLRLDNDHHMDFIGDVDGDGRNEIVCDSAYAFYTVYATNGISTAVAQKGSSAPTSFQLRQNYPNPFNPSTVISYSLPANAPVTLKIYDVLGREVKTLVNERQAAGNHSVTLNASGLASGVYFYQLQTNGKALAKKLMVIK